LFQFEIIIQNWANLALLIKPCWLGRHGDLFPWSWPESRATQNYMTASVAAFAFKATNCWYLLWYCMTGNIGRRKYIKFIKHLPNKCFYFCLLCICKAPFEVWNKQLKFQQEWKGLFCSTLQLSSSPNW